MHPKRTEQDQLALEKKHHELGVEDYRRRVAKMQEKGFEAATDYGTELLHDAVKDMIPKLTQWMTDATSRPGVRNAAVAPLSLLPLDVACLITARLVIDGVSKERTVTGVAVAIGGEIEDEVRMQAFASQSPALYDKIGTNLNNHPLGGSSRVRSSTWRHAAKKFQLVHEKWSTMTKAIVGSRLIDLFVETSGLVSTYQPSRKSSLRLYPNPTLLEWIDNAVDRGSLLSPRRRPMVCRPRDWTNLTDGGYYTPALRTPLVVCKLRGYRQELEASTMPDVYGAVNALQRTAYRVNVPVLDIARQLFATQVSFEGWPTSSLIEPGTAPNFETHPEDWKTWKTRAGDIMRKNLKDNSVRVQNATVIDIAQEYREEPEMYFPHMLDFRGRMYPRPPALQPQGTDLAKGLLTFADVKPLGRGGVMWLAIHLANTYGVDKVSFDDRIQWVEDNWVMLESIAADPIGDLRWTEADAPWQFLAACIEWNRMAQHPEGTEAYPCSLPVVVDGSCNGIQLYALAMRDAVAGKLVNCTNSLTPSDIYGAVADRLFNRLSSCSTPQNPEWPKMWQTYGIDRKLTKRPVMILPYSGTKTAFRAYILDRVKEKSDRGEDHPFGKDLKRAAAWLAVEMWEASKQIVVGPRVAMDWLQQCVALIYKTGDKTVPLSWISPSGFAVQMHYAKNERVTLQNRTGTSTIRLTLLEPTNKIDTRRQRQGVAPNFVHSLDAALLCRTVNAAVASGITAFVSVHDCYGTHAADVQLLSEVLRAEAVRMFTEQDVLQEWHTAMQCLTSEPLPPPPPKGTLDINDLLTASFFFA